MYIMKRSSGGRGEYEIAEKMGQLTPHDMLDRDLLVKFDDMGFKNTGVSLKNQGGKLRLRCRDNKTIQLARQVQAALLLPRPTRVETALPGGQPTVMEDRYIVRRIHFKSVKRISGHLQVTLDRLDLYNGSQSEDIDFDDRFKRVRRLHADADQLPPPISQPLHEHEAIIQETGPVNVAVEKIVMRLMKATADMAVDFNVDYLSGADVLEPLAEILALPTYEKPVSVDDIPPMEFELRRREISKWRRWAAARGKESAKFRNAVREAYRSTCIVSGVRLPKNQICRVPGVDSAHILPWAGYDLDLVCNGLCLSKQYHWAFDQGLIAIRWDGDGRAYRVSVTDLAREALAEEQKAMAMLEEVAGPIPREHLPDNPGDWPRPEFLEKLYEKLEE